MVYYLQTFYMNKFFRKELNSNIKYEIYHGWHIYHKKWFIDLSLPKYKNNNIIQMFETKKRYLNFLNKII